MADVEEQLADEHCQQIDGKTRPLNETDAQSLLDQLAGWNIFYKDGEPRLVKSYDFEDFEHAINFTDEVAEIANIENHHPAILTEYGKVTLDWWTHKIKGLHRNDFIMAAKSDDLYVSQT